MNIHVQVFGDTFFGVNTKDYNCSNMVCLTCFVRNKKTVFQNGFTISQSHQ
jgi:hypothetical protein